MPQPYAQPKLRAASWAAKGTCLCRSPASSTHEKMVYLIPAFNLLYVAKQDRSGDLNYSTYTLPTIFLLAAVAYLFVPSVGLEKLCQRVIRAVSASVYVLVFVARTLYSASK